MIRQKGFIAMAALRTAKISAVLAVASFTVSLPSKSDAVTTIRIGGTGAALESMRLIGKAFTKSNPDIHVLVLPSLGSSGGIKAFAAGKLELALSARPLKEKERGAGIQENEYARTPIVFATHHDNPVSSIDLETVTIIYSGKTLNWPSGERLRLILRPESESDIKLLRLISPAMNEAVEAAFKRHELHIAINDQENVSALEKIPGSLGVTTLGQIMAEERRIKPLAFNGLTGTVEALRSGRYPYARSFYLISRTDQEPAVQAFANFIHSIEGQAILTRTGHLAVGIDGKPET